MVILIGIASLIFMCSSILILAFFVISLAQQNTSAAKTTDFYGYLFDVYEENIWTESKK